MNTEPDHGDTLGADAVEESERETDILQRYPELSKIDGAHSQSAVDEVVTAQQGVSGCDLSRERENLKKFRTVLAQMQEMLDHEQ